MPLLLAALIGISGAPAAGLPVLGPTQGQPANCPATSRYEASRRGRTPQAKRLNQLPDADVYLTVYRVIDKCNIPVIVEHGVTGR